MYIVLLLLICILAIASANPVAGKGIAHRKLFMFNGEQDDPDHDSYADDFMRSMRGQDKKTRSNPHKDDKEEPFNPFSFFASISAIFVMIYLFCIHTVNP